MNRVPETVLARVDGHNVTLSMLLTSPDLRQRLESVLAAATERELVWAACARAHIEASTAEVQAAFDDFRRQKRLLSAEKARQWLAQSGMTLDDAEHEARYEVLRKKWRERLGVPTDSYFHQHRSQFQCVALARVLVRDQDLASELLAELEEGEVTFEELVQRNSLDAASRFQAGFWGEFHRGEVPLDMEGAVFGATPGEVVGPFSYAAGWVLLKVLAVRDGTLDHATRQVIAERLYQQWLEEARRQAQIEVLPPHDIMQIGVVFPQTEMPADVGFIRDYARNAAKMGYQHLLASDHVVGADPQDHPGWAGPCTVDSSFHEPFTLFGYLAAAEPRLELVTGVIILPQRQAVLVAKQAAQIDILKRGRFRLGVGLGWNPVEYQALGVEFGTRARRFEEQLDVMRRLWSERSLSYQGEFHSFVGAGIKHLPVQRPIPLWIGAVTEPALRRAAVLGDGVFPWFNPLEGSWRVTLDKMRAWREASGKPWEGFGIEPTLRVFGADATPARWQAEAAEWRALGATHLCVSTMGGGLPHIDAHVNVLGQVVEALGRG